MLIAYEYRQGISRRTVVPEGQLLPPDTIWVDLNAPTPTEQQLVQQSLQITLPTTEEMEEIEVSSRLFLGKGATYMRCEVITKSDTAHPEVHTVTFILTKRFLVTLRYCDPASFTVFGNRALAEPGLLGSSETALFGLLETIVGRSGQLLRRLVAELESVSRIVFLKTTTEEDRHIAINIGLKTALYSIGRMGELTNRVQQSLLSIDRMLVFLGDMIRVSPDMRERVDTMQEDLHSLIDTSTSLNQKVSFLLDATLGFITAEQNQVIKLFSIAAVILLPPTLVASVYGMNFKVMPELSWQYGYPMAVVLMLIAGIVPYMYFKRRGWI